MIDTHLKFAKSLSDFKTKPIYLVLHHEAGNGTVEQIHNYHLSKGWSGIAYHAYVRKDGTVYAGRPLNKQGGHCSGYNSNSIGICFEGNFCNEKMLPQQITGGVKAINEILAKYPDLKIVGHKELVATACPGTYFPIDYFKQMENEDMTRYNTIEEIPSYLQEETKQLIDAGALKGGDKGLDVTADMLRSMIIMKRYIDSQK